MQPSTIIPKGALELTDHRHCLLRGIARRAVHSTLRRITAGRIVIREDGRLHTVGALTPDCPMTATITVHNPCFYKHVAFGGSVGAGRAYIDGHWTCDDLTALIRILIRNEAALGALDRGWGRLAAPLRKLTHAFRRNTIRGSRRNITAHYDVGNEFYRLVLDETLTYSCGIFHSAHTTLHEASVAKIDRLCRKLDLQPTDHLLEIGGGWGSFATYAARHFHCRVTTTTISDEQYTAAVRRVRHEGLTDRVTVLKEDYRDLRGRYDKLVSVEMIEAVGHQYFDAFFHQIGRLLEPTGRAAIQAIVTAERFFASARDSVDFIKAFVFPGCCIPAVGPLLTSMRRTTDLDLTHLEDITPHYARTLTHWRRNLLERIEDVRHLGYSDTFVRLWDFYLCYCEAGFHERTIGSVQLVLDKPHAAAREAWRTVTDDVRATPGRNHSPTSRVLPYCHERLG